MAYYGVLYSVVWYVKALYTVVWYCIIQPKRCYILIRALVQQIVPYLKIFLWQNDAPEYFFRLRVNFVWG